MKYKNILIALIIILFSLSNAYGNEKSIPSLNGAVFIDPFFGGDEKGPMLSLNTPAKDITLYSSRKLKDLIKQNNIRVDTSRDRDVLLTLDSRVLVAKSLGANLYVSFKASRTNKDCIRLYYPQQKQSKQQRSKNIRESLRSLTLADRIKRSAALVETICSDLKKKTVSLCVEKQAGSKQFENDYILENADSPVVIIDFEVSGSTSPYVLDATLMDKIISAVAEGIMEDLATAQPSK